MKLKTFLALLVASAFAFSFSACSDDDDDDDSSAIAQQAVGDYNITCTAYLYDGNEYKDLGVDQEKISAKAVLNGSNLQLQTDEDVINIVKIAEASNGFTFDVEDFIVKEDDKTFILTGYKGYALESSDGKSVSYDGGYIAASKKLEFYMEMPQEYVEAMIALELASDEDFLTTLIATYLVDEEVGDAVVDVVDALIEKYKLVMKFSCTKK